jgi:CheY-like chemotaxis protein
MWSTIVKAIWGESPVEIASREVLVIEPSATKRRALADAVRSASVPVVELRSHTEAMARIAAGLRPILAIAGADRGGVELAAELRADPLNDDVRLLLLAPVAHLSKALDAGADVCLEEPINESVLVAQIQELAS